MIKITQKLKNHLWWLIINVDYDYSRIAIADHEINGDILTLWLEDKHDFKNSLDECLQVDLSLKQFAKVIKAENLNSYEGIKMHPKKNFTYKARIEINEPIKWYIEDASPSDQQWAREAMLKTLLTQLVETEVYDDCNTNQLFS
ncbi:hypothetical protein HDF18_13500 [Mucilaginibacter sp. X5P1]|uniref:hypothetical protein n=1 Tax=Mucilaginibacter sp. X5P1 TaxID=2723088 RepID=UPI001609D755|nr:hypothetical protein [Mucilaginibacter sp. X5P1]MBB6141642.1 hypothetical protein [Mucilaginibacter sp. X5P1]